MYYYLANSPEEILLLNRASRKLHRRVRLYVLIAYRKAVISTKKLASNINEKLCNQVDLSRMNGWF